MPLHVVDHPLAHDALLELRDARTAPVAFRRASRRISLLLAVEALRDLPRTPHVVTTPLGPAEGQAMRADVVLVPVLRAGLGMLEPMLELVPEARVGHIGLQRDETTAVASRYYCRLPPDLGRSQVVLLDPMLATGGSAVAAVTLLKEAGARHIRMVSIVAAPEGIAVLAAHHPDVAVYTPAVDKELNAHKYIVPGLGDYGDRLYGTL